MSQRFTPEHKARILLIGAGGIGQRHIRGYLKTGRATIDIVEPDAGRRSHAEGTYDIGTSYPSTDDAPFSEYDAAVICAPANTHVSLGMECIEAELPFFVEKPLSVTMDGVETMCSEVRRLNLPVRVGYVRRSSIETHELRRRANSGEIGELKLAYVNMSQDFRKYRPDYKKTYYAKKHMGGGAILDAASHAIDLLLWIFGPIHRVTAMHDTMVLENVECEDTVLMIFSFASGAMAQLAINQFQKPNIQVFEVIGTEGNLKLDMADLAIADDDSGTWRHNDYAEGIDPMEIHENRFSMQANLFLDTVEGTDTELATLDEARDNLRVALAAKRSYTEGIIVEL